jgi:hypothetical protein
MSNDSLRRLAASAAPYNLSKILPELPIELEPDPAPIYKFDPLDPEVRDYLERLGLPDTVIDSGMVDDAMLEEFKIDAFVFYTVLFSEGLDNYLSSREAQYGNLLAHNIGGKRKENALFRSDICPNNFSARTVIGNDSGVDYAPHAAGLGGVIPEYECSPEDLRKEGFKTTDMEGLFFDEKVASPNWKPWGESVLSVYRNLTSKDEKGVVKTELAGRGSAVIVSPDGDVLTAWHVLAPDEEEKDKTLSYSFTFRGKTYHFTEKDVYFKEVDSDFAIIHVPSLGKEKDLPYATFSEREPYLGEDIVAIGYPALADEYAKLYEDSKQETPKLYSTGVYEENQVWNKTHNFHQVSARLYFGDSGGAVFNSQGELIGIVQGIDIALGANGSVTTGEKSYASSIIPEDLTPKARTKFAWLRQFQRSKGYQSSLYENDDWLGN